jgi:hypothetical protein
VANPQPSHPTNSLTTSGSIQKYPTIKPTAPVEIATLNAQTVVLQRHGTIITETAVHVS